MFKLIIITILISFSGVCIAETIKGPNPLNFGGTKKEKALVIAHIKKECEKKTYIPEVLRMKRKQSELESYIKLTKVKDKKLALKIGEIYSGDGFHKWLNMYEIEFKFSKTILEW